MIKEMNFTRKLLKLLPYWHYKIDKPFKLFIKDKMSLETYYCLQILLENGPMTMSQICNKLNISKQRATTLIEKLYEHKFVERKTNERDRRYIDIFVSKTGKDYIEKNIYNNKEFINSLEKGLTKEDLIKLEGSINTLLEVLTKIK
ncbi:MarR family winged helix-turn-helix transcriptional regulator [uncultured Anaerofustis sp.]|uniref:MarR family winged helix-turn-helix transcriptional regulator n=2 Tax=uncultured Anaerofustis sp. TaxID=904996 RepID=UPI0025EDC487|nr:MarR family transcriptional regulator [uncultured Anaerofustis sp.]